MLILLGLYSFMNNKHRLDTFNNITHYYNFYNYIEPDLKCEGLNTDKLDLSLQKLKKEQEDREYLLNLLVAKNKNTKIVKDSLIIQK